jgi:ubiquinone/menaquinone biosynthesis C-methylase UbiE
MLAVPNGPTLLRTQVGKRRCVMSSSVETFQISAEQAEFYESKFVPAIFGEWAPHVVDAAGVVSGQAVLDVACGTGVVAREAADRMGEQGRVVGLDLNEAMLGVARRVRPNIEWKQGDAAELSFPDASFDVVLCQAALMFFPDRARALSEMARVVTPDGTVCVQVFGSAESQPAYGSFIEVAARHAGPEAIDLLNSYWVLGDLDLVGSLLEAAGLETTTIHTHLCTARFDSIEEAVRTEVEGTPLIDRISDDVYRRILEDSRNALRPFTTESGTAEFPVEGYVISARKR